MGSASPAGLKQLFAGADLALTGSGLVIDGGTIATAAIVGILTTLVASVVPALKASRVAPLAALRDVTVDRSAVSKTRVIAGLLLAGAGAAAVIAGASSGDGAVGRVGLGAIAVLVGAVVLGPVVARPAAAVLGGGAAVAGGFTGRVARRNAMRNPRRIAASASALMVGTAVVALFTTFGASLKATIDDAVDNRFGGDLIVEQDGFSGAALSPELAGAIAEQPEVDDAVGVAFAAASIDGDDVEPAATDFVRLDAMLDMGVAEGSVDDLGPGRIAISEHYAEEHRTRHRRHDPLDVRRRLHHRPRGRRDLHRADVVRRPRDVRPRTGLPHARQGGDVVVFVDLADGVSEADGLAAVDDGDRALLGTRSPDRATSTRTRSGPRSTRCWP